MSSCSEQLMSIYPVCSFGTYPSGTVMDGIADRVKKEARGMQEIWDELGDGDEGTQRKRAGLI